MEYEKNLNADNRTYNMPPFPYALYFCTLLTRLYITVMNNLGERILHITACIIGGSNLSIIVLVAFTIGLYFLPTGAAENDK